jgi:hypothetical protein
MESSNRTIFMPWQFLLLTGPSVSTGWGVRGQFGHEYGAAWAGALGGVGVALLAGRPDWHVGAGWPTARFGRGARI